MGAGTRASVVSSPSPPEGLVAYKVADLLIDLARPMLGSKTPCGKPKTCMSCTKCTSTGMSRHKFPETYNTCDTLATASVRKQLKAQLRKIVAKPRPRAARKRTTARKK